MANIMYKFFYIFTNEEYLSSVLLFVITTYFAIYKLKTYRGLPALQVILDFNYPKMLDERRYPKVWPSLI